MYWGVRAAKILLGLLCFQNQITTTVMNISYPTNSLNQRWIILTFVFVVLLGLQACDSVTDTNPNIDTKASQAPEGGALETVQYSYGESEDGTEHVVSVSLNPGFKQERRTFESFDTYYAFLDKLTEQSALTVNADLYRRLVHANNPAEISVLDTDGKVIIGDHEYTVTEIGAYQQDTGAPNQSRELIEYWGEDGKAVERELSQLYGLQHRPEELATLTFKNPFVQQKAQEILQGTAAKTQNRDTRYYGNTTICLPDNDAQFFDKTCYPVRFLLWNQSTGRTFRRRAKGGTQAQAQIGSTWYGFGHYSLPSSLLSRVRMKVSVNGGNGSSSSECIGALNPGPLYYKYNPPYRWFSSTFCSEVTASTSRKRNRGTTSNHGAGTHDYFSNESWSSEFGTYWLIYYYTGGWKFENVYVR